MPENLFYQFKLPTGVHIEPAAGSNCALAVAHRIVGQVQRVGVKYAIYRVFFQCLVFKLQGIFAHLS